MPAEPGQLGAQRCGMLRICSTLSTRYVAGRDGRDEKFPLAEREASEDNGVAAFSPDLAFPKRFSVLSISLHAIYTFEFLLYRSVQLTKPQQ